MLEGVFLFKAIEYAAISLFAISQLYYEIDEAFLLHSIRHLFKVEILQFLIML